jgi:predicted GNAT family N-acyltransferase
VNRDSQLRSQVQVGLATAEETYPLWRDVLREGRNVAREPSPVGTVHLAARAPSGQVIGVVQLSPAPCPFQPGVRAAWQLRGMATHPQARGQGVGRALIAEALRQVTGRGGDLVWCHARVSAAGFYARMGFRQVTGEYDKPGVGPHVGMFIELTRAEDSGSPGEPALRSPVS